jgi:hypothetical protein
LKQLTTVKLLAAKNVKANMKRQKLLVLVAGLCGVTYLVTPASGQNTAYGSAALGSLSGGEFNAAFGSAALPWLVAGDHNTAVGVNAIYNPTNCNYDTGIGYATLYNENGLGFNTALGYEALGAITSGSNNIGIGYQGGISLTTGTGNICIGASGSSSDADVIRIGGGQTATYIAGISGATASGGVEVYVNTSGKLGTMNSSSRFKRDIRSMDDASDVVLSLRPVTFHYKSELDPQGLPQFGLVAEEVEKVDPDLVARDDKNQVYTVRYQAVSAMLLNEFIKEHRIVEEQNTKIVGLEEKAAKVDTLEKRLAGVEQALHSLAKEK